VSVAERSRAVTEHVTRETILGQCAAFPGSELSYPFGDDTAVFKVGGKMHALVSLDGEPGSVTLKCDPDAAIGLRNSYAAIGPGYYMNKRHWITVELGGDAPNALVTDLVADSYELVADGLPARLRPQDRDR
jgi:predicted DNA-binding protein (MmcQ/YjbR family)